MIPSQGGREGCKGSPNPPSNGSEDNGFTNRPRVAGLYATNLSREELVRFSSGETTRSRGPARDILERSSREIGSQRSLNLPVGIAEEFELLDRSRLGISRTPQPLRRGDRYEPRPRFDPDFARHEYHGSPSIEAARARDHHQQQDERVARGPDALRGSVLEFPRGEETPWIDSGVDNSRMPIPGRDYGGRRGQDAASSSASILISPASETGECHGPSPPEVEKPSPPPYAGLSPPEYTGHEYGDNVETPSPIFATYPLASYAEETRHGRSRSSVSDVELEFAAREERSRANERLAATESGQASAADRSSASRQHGHRGASESEVIYEKSTDEDVSRPRDVARLRPPLAAAAGTSADSGTGDSGSAEIQVDPLGTPRAATADEISDDRAENGAENGAAAGKSAVKTPTGNNKQTVKLFTKESLDRLENRTVQLVRDYGFQPKRRMSVEDGAVLPNKYEPFPTDLYGRPLEEIDNFIYDEVSSLSRYLGSCCALYRSAVNFHH